jgi:hypothetical protein
MLDAKVGSVKDAIIATSTEATQEATLEELLAKVVAKWAAIELSVIPYKDSKDVYILGSIDNIQASLYAWPPLAGTSGVLVVLPSPTFRCTSPWPSHLTTPAALVESSCLMLLPSQWSVLRTLHDTLWVLCLWWVVVHAN